MLNIGPLLKSDQSVRILCLGAHCDDLEIGCGGTILRILQSYRNAEVVWVVFAGRGQRKKEAISAARHFLGSAAKKKIIIREFKDGYFPSQSNRIKDSFEKLKQTVNPHIIFTHYRHDLHQDHRIISELTWNTFRDHFIMEYEIIKYDGDMGRPNLFVGLSEDVCRKKIAYIMKAFKTQRAKQWFTEDVFRALMRLRGVEAKSPSNHAEAFYCRKITLSLDAKSL